jgi:hypothetical protein
MIDEKPEVILDRLPVVMRTDEAMCAEIVEQLITAFPIGRLREAVLPRLGDLRGVRGGVLLQLAAVFADEELGIALAEALSEQPDLPADRAWEALEIVQGLDLLDRYPELAIRQEELDDLIGEDDFSLDELAEHLDGNNDEVWIALQGLAGIESEVRVDIIRGLAERRPIREGLVELLRLLTYAHDPTTQEAALAALESFKDDPLALAAWIRLRNEQDDPIVLSRAKLAVGPGKEIAERTGVKPQGNEPRLLHASVSALDGEGRWLVILAAEHQGEWPVAIFTADVFQGVIDVLGVVADSEEAMEEMREALSADHRSREWLADAPELALGMLSGSLMLCGPETPPSLRYWLERTLGVNLAGRPLLAPMAEEGFGEWTAEQALDDVRAILDAAPGWVDRFKLFDEFAKELLFRNEQIPDPVRDSGAYRFLFENRLLDRMELDRRILMGMSLFWRAGGENKLSTAASKLAEQLADEQFVVPGHPFVVEFTTRSLLAAQRRLVEVKKSLRLEA